MSFRKEKLEEQIRRIIGDLLLQDIKDPRIGFVTVTKVDLSKDYSQAKVGISILGSAREMRKTLEGIESAVGYIQHKVGKSLRIRSTPRLSFFPDSSVAEGARIVGLINGLENDSAYDGSDIQTEESIGKVNYRESDEE
jgi:ribosome-binding factor A